MSAIFTTIAQLETFPFLGRTGQVDKTFEIVVPRSPYIVVYSIPDQLHITILRVYHAKQKYPPEENNG